VRWIAEYILEPDGPRVARIDVHHGSLKYLEPLVALFDQTGEEWHVEVGIDHRETDRGQVWTGFIGPTQLAGTATPGVYQDLGEAPDLTAKMIRRMRPAYALQLVRKELAQLRGAPEWATALLTDQWRQRLMAPRRAAPLIVLVITAAVYVAAIDAGERAPVAAVARALGLRQAQVRDRLYKARQLGYLEPRDPGRGRPRGRLTTAAIDLLEKEIPS
jgi:hypothetical protein